MGDAAVEDDVQGAPPAGPKRASSHRRRSTEFLRGACRAPYKRAWNLDDAREGSGDDDEQSGRGARRWCLSCSAVQKTEVPMPHRSSSSRGFFQGDEAHWCSL